MPKKDDELAEKKKLGGISKVYISRCIISSREAAGVFFFFWGGGVICLTILNIPVKYFV